jgi:PAS domain S-box-containing protein
MIAELCSAFVNVPAEKVDDEINRWMAFVVTTLGVDRGTLFQISVDNSSGVLTHTWAPTKSLSLAKNSIAELREGIYVLPWSVEKMLRGEHIVFSSIDELPDNATEDRNFFASQGTKSNATYPLSVGGQLVGALAFSSVSAERQWSEELVQRLQMVAHVFANALARKRADIELKDAADRYQTLFESANDAILVLNENRIVECNLNCVPMFGCENRTDLIGHGPWELSPPLQDDGENSLDKIVRLFEQARDGFPQTFYWKCRRNDESIFDAEISINAFKVSGMVLLLAIVRDISIQAQAKAILRESNDRLQAERILLGEKNSALRAILTQIEQQRIEYEEKVCSSLEHILTPLVKKLRVDNGKLNNKELTKLEDALESIIGKGVDTYKENYAKLSPRETEICELIVKGLSSKEISESLHVSPQTIHKHREFIRRKFNIQNLEINLPTYLRTKM